MEIVLLGASLIPGEDLEVEVSVLENARPLADHWGHFAALIQNTPAILFEQDGQLRYRWLENAPPGLVQGDVTGKSDADLFPEATARSLEQLKRLALETGEPRSGMVALPLDGRPVPYHWTFFPLAGEGGRPGGLAGLAVPSGHALPEGAGPDGNGLSGMRLAGERVGLLASLSLSFAETGHDYARVLETVARLVAQSAGDACAICLLGDESRFQVSFALHHVDPPAEAAFSGWLQEAPDQARAILAGQPQLDNLPVRIDDIMQREHILARLPEKLRGFIQTRSPIHAFLALPLRTSRGLLGVLSVWRSRSKQTYNADDQSFWQDIADRAALAIENARLYADEVNRNRQLNALHDATTALLSTLDLDVLLGRILDAVQAAIPAAERGILYLVAPSTGKLEVRATSGFNDPRIRRTGQLHNSRARQAMIERRPLLIQDMLALAGSQPAAEKEPMRSAIFAPLVLEDEVLGTLSLSASVPGAFQSSDLQLLVSFAATTTAAVHNAMLHAEVQKLAITDPLTGLYNRRGLSELGRHEVERFQRFGSPLSAIMLDIDFFKQVNDTYGHAAGDQVLCGLAERCRSLIRQVDIIGRFGGEEFAIILPETDLFQASAVAERLRKAVEEEPVFTEQGAISIKISLGISRAARGLTGLDALIERADEALYQAKQHGRNRVEIV